MSGAGAGKWADLGPRVIAALVLAVVSLGALFWGGFVFAGFMAAATFIMCLELLEIVKADWRVKRINVLALGLAGGASVLLAGWSGPAALALAVAGFVLVAAISSGRALPIPLAGYAVIVLAGLSVVLLRFHPGGFWIVLWIILCVVAADIGGYAFGRSFQGPKFWPAVSPQKTWSGVLGGMLLSLIVAYVYGAQSDGNIGAFLAFGALIAAVSVIGDLMESALKRRFKVKDSGTILPGHGGLLDRFDGMSAVMILFLLISLVTDLNALLGVNYSPPTLGMGL